MDELLRFFLEETAHCLGECEADLAALHRNPDDSSTFDKISRLICSVRETSQFLGLPDLHAAARDGAEILASACHAQAQAKAGAVPAVAKALIQMRAVISGLGNGALAAPDRLLARIADLAALNGGPPDALGAAPSEPCARPQADARPPVKRIKKNRGATVETRVALVAEDFSERERRAQAPGSLDALPESATGQGDAANAGGGHTIEDLRAQVERLSAMNDQMLQALRRLERSAGSETAEVRSPIVEGSGGRVQSMTDSRGDIDPAAGPSIADEERPVFSGAYAREIAAHPTPIQGSDSANGDPPATSKDSGEVASLQGDADGTSGGVRLLVFSTADGTARAMPMRAVRRLEEVNLKSMHGSRGQWVMRSGDELVPLIPFQSPYQLPARGRAPVIVVSYQGVSLGLLVDSIDEAVDNARVAASSVDRPGCHRTANISGRTVEIIDPVDHLEARLRGRRRIHRRDGNDEAFRDSNSLLGAAPNLFARKPLR